MDAKEITVKLVGPADKPFKVVDLKEQITEQLSIVPVRQRLIFQGKALKDSEPLSAY